MFLVWINAQVSGLLNVLSQILSCERFKLPEGILRMAKEPQLAREGRKELAERKGMDEELLEMAREECCYINLPGYLY